MTPHKSVFYILTSVILLWLNPNGRCQETSHASSATQRVYVVPFTSRRPIDPRLLLSFTEEFQRALVQENCYEVVERIDIDQLIRQIRNENEISRIRDLGKDVPARMRALGAQAVFFGQVDDDVDSGEIAVAAKMEYFSTRITWNDSVLMKRGVINDHSSRVDAIRRLIHNLCPATGKSNPNPSPTPVVPQTLVRGSAQGFDIQLTSCRRSGQTVVCNLTVTNENAFRPFTMCSGDRTQLFDGKNREFNSARATLVDKTSSTCVAAQLLQGKPAEAKLAFENVPSDVSEAYLLRISLSSNGNWSDLQLPGKIPIR